MLFKNFNEFFTEVGCRPSKGYSIDRINNEGHYEKGNIHWATALEQSKNSRGRWGGLK